METLEGGTHLDAVGLDGNEAMAGQLESPSTAIAGCGDIRLLGSHDCGYGFDVGSKVKDRGSKRGREKSLGGGEGDCLLRWRGRGVLAQAP
jgi:hypothetical protein